MRTMQIYGRLTADPEFKVVGDKELCTFRVAVKDDYTRERTHFFNVKAWGKKGEIIANNFTKGKEIVVTGKMDYEEWNDKDGQKRNGYSVNADSFFFVGKKE